MGDKNLDFTISKRSYNQSVKTWSELDYAGRINGNWVDWLLDAMTFSLGSLSDDSSTEKAQVVNQLAVDCVEEGFESIDCYFDAGIRGKNYAFLSV